MRARPDDNFTKLKYFDSSHVQNEFQNNDSFPLKPQNKLQTIPILNKHVVKHISILMKRKYSLET